jgi:hypothetical protein
MRPKLEPGILHRIIRRIQMKALEINKDAAGDEEAEVAAIRAAFPLVETAPFTSPEELDAYVEFYYFDTVARNPPAPGIN